MKKAFALLGRLFGRKPKPEVAAPEPAVAPAPDRKAAAQRPARAPRQHSPQRLTEVLRGPHVSEKSVRLAEGEQHTFEVARDASRGEVKAAVERMFEVEVAEVRVANVRGKRKRGGRRAGWRKAYVRLTPGQTLDAGGAAA